jgi:hypothetical protein
MDKVPARAALEIAEGTRSPHQVLTSYGFTDDQIEWLLEYEPFTREVERCREDLRINGYTFRAKARLLAEEHLATAHRMISDPEAPHAVRADMVKWLTKMGGLEPKEAKGEDAQAITVTINLGDKPIVIDSTASPAQPVLVQN